MTLNKYFVFIPSAMKTTIQKAPKAISEKEAQRQALLKQAQVEGGL